MDVPKSGSFVIPNHFEPPLDLSDDDNLKEKGPPPFFILWLREYFIVIYLIF